MKTKMEKIAEVLEFIRSVNDFTEIDQDKPGVCLKFFLLLKQRFPDGIGYYNSYHCVMMIDDIMFDCDGLFEPDPNEPDYFPMSEYGFRHMYSSFNNTGLTAAQVETLHASCSTI